MIQTFTAPSYWEGAVSFAIEMYLVYNCFENQRGAIPDTNKHFVESFLRFATIELQKRF